MTYAEKIRQSRETLLMTQGELATELGVNSITVCRWETGKTEPSIKAKKLLEICANGKDLLSTKTMDKTQEEITRNMRSNKCRDTKPELLLRSELWKRGLRYRKNYKKLVGKPDIVFVGKKIAIFVDGKMWHGYDWENQKNDFKSHRDFWIPKIERNIARDKSVNQQLENDGWTILRFWDFEIKSTFRIVQTK